MGEDTFGFSVLEIEHNKSLTRLQLFYQIPYRRTGLTADSQHVFYQVISGDFQSLGRLIRILWVCFCMFLLSFCLFRRSDEAKGQLHQAVKRKKESISDQT